ncbi:MAG: PcfJ domain-containing protein, partial [Gammaproteobacteria bacterium]|nr:PcfJ domain-containing protein [Gammaproteobacteria bacterium]
MRTNSVAHTRQLELGRRLARRTLPHLGDGQPLPANVPAWMESSRDAEAFQSQLATLRKALHKLLDNPLRLVEKRGGREVILFESIIYRISPKARHIDALRVDSSGHLFQDGYTRDVFPVLSRRMSLLPLLDRLGIWERTPQADLFLDSKTLAIRKLALAAAVWPALKRDWRFRYLRHSLLPQRLALDTGVLSLALRCRLDPKESVATKSFTSVWQQKESLETVARENSGLLPLIQHGLERQVFDPNFDLVQALRTNLLNRGVTPAAWRYLTRHGARLFRPFWERKPDADLFHLAAEYLCRLDEMGLPPPPSLAMARTWLDIETGYCNGELHWNRGWWNLPAPILSAAFHNPRRTDPTFLREFAAAAHWAIFEQPTLDSNQRKAGWDWIKRQWQAWQAEQNTRAAAGDAAWTSLLGEIRADDLAAVPLTTEIQLVEEGLTMRNCLATYAEWCLNGEVRVFSIRRIDSGKRLADLSIVPEENGAWVVSDIKGYANTASPTYLDNFAWWV